MMAAAIRFVYELPTTTGDIFHRMRGRRLDSNRSQSQAGHPTTTTLSTRRLKSAAQPLRRVNVEDSLGSIGRSDRPLL
jgi:hypothetical protein